MAKDPDQPRQHHAFPDGVLQERATPRPHAGGTGAVRARLDEMDAVDLCLGTAWSRSGEARLAEPLAVVGTAPAREPVAEITRDLIEALTAVNLYLDAGVRLFAEDAGSQPARLGSVIRKARARAERATGMVHQLRRFLKLTGEPGGE